MDAVVLSHVGASQPVTILFKVIVAVPQGHAAIRCAEPLEHLLPVVSIQNRVPTRELRKIDSVRLDDPFETERMNGSDPQRSGIDSKGFDSLLNLISSPVGMGSAKPTAGARSD